MTSEKEKLINILRNDVDQLCREKDRLTAEEITILNDISKAVVMLKDHEQLSDVCNVHAMDFETAWKLLVYCGFGCDWLSPSGFMDWLKQKMREDRRLEGAFLAARATIVVTSSHGGEQSGCNPEN